MSTATYWAYTLNNPDENETALVHSLYERAAHAIKANVFQHEVGESGTPHFQGLITLQKQQRLSFVRKLLPRAHWTPCTKAEHIENMKAYVQKRDDTSDGTTTHQQSNPPVMDALSILRKMIRDSLEGEGPLMSYEQWSHPDNASRACSATDRQTYNRYVARMQDGSIGDGHWDHFRKHLKRDELSLVEDDPYNAKIFIQPAYTRLKKDFLEQIYKHERVKYYTPEDADDHAGDEQDAGGSVGWEHSTAEIPTVVQEEADADGDGEELDEDAESGSESSSGTDGTASVCSTDTSGQ